MDMFRKNKMLAIENSCIPDEIVFEIMKSVPAKSLLRFRCVSKFFCSLLSEPSFVEAHLKSSLAQSRVISCLTVQYPYKEDMIYSLSEGSDQLGLALDPVKYLDQQCFSKFQLLESVNGLLCLWNFYGDVAVCNPFTKQHVILPRPIKKALWTGCSLGFDPTTKRHKVLMTLQVFKTTNWIFTIGLDKSWRKIPKTYPLLLRGYGHAYINGVIYSIDEYKHMIYAFSVGDEKVIRTIPLPLEESSRGVIMEIKGQVALLNHTDDEVLLCILNGTDETWVKHTIKLPSKLCCVAPDHPLYTSNNRGEILSIDPSNRISPIFLYNFGRKQWRIVDATHKTYKRQYRKYCSFEIRVNIVASMWSLT